MLMRIVNRQRDSSHCVDCSQERVFSVDRPVPSRDRIQQTPTLDQSHAKEGLPLVFPNFVDWDDIGVHQSGYGFRFYSKPRSLGLNSEIGKSEHLDGNDAIQTCLPRAVYDSHASASNLTKKFVVANTP